MHQICTTNKLVDTGVDRLSCQPGSRKEKTKRASESFTLTNDVCSPPPSHVCVTMRVGWLNAYFHRWNVWLVLGLCVLCLVMVFGVNKCVQSSGIGACFFSNIMLFGIMCVQVPYSDLGEGFHQFVDFGVGDLRVLEESNSCCMYSATYPCHDYNEWQYYPPQLGQEWVENGIFIKFSVGGFCGEPIVVVSEFKYVFFEVWDQVWRVVYLQVGLL